MNQPVPSMAQQVATAAGAFQQLQTGNTPRAVAAVVSGDTLVITVQGALSPAEQILVKTPAGAAKVQEFHRQLFASSAASLRADIKRITGVAVREAVAEIATASGTVVQLFTSGTLVQVFQLEARISPETWNKCETPKPKSTMPYMT